MRKPSPAEVSSAFPSLSELRARRALALGTGAFGALVLGAATVPTQSPVCANSRVGELRAHGAVAAEKLTRGGPVAALDEIAVAVGLARHPPAPVLTERLMRPGEMMAVGPVAPVVPVVPVEPLGVVPDPPVSVIQPPIAASGGVRPVTRLPPTVPSLRVAPTPRVRPNGGPMMVDPGRNSPL